MCQTTLRPSLNLFDVPKVLLPSTRSLTMVSTIRDDAKSHAPSLTIRVIADDAPSVIGINYQDACKARPCTQGVFAFLSRSASRCVRCVVHVLGWLELSMAERLVSGPLRDFGLMLDGCGRECYCLLWATMRSARGIRRLACGDV